MQIIKPKIIIPKITKEKLDNPEAIVNWIADSARIAYQSFDKRTGIQSEERIISSCIRSGHCSILEHEYLSFDFICDRGLSHELVRHRIASYTQESTRYVKYNNDMEFIQMIEYNPCFHENISKNNILQREHAWVEACQSSEASYLNMINLGSKPQEARSVLNNSLKTQIRITRNIRNMREFLILRADKAAHPHAKELAIPLLLLLQEKLPCMFGDIIYDKDFFDTYIGEEWKNYFIFKEEL